MTSRLLSIASVIGGISLCAAHAAAQDPGTRNDVADSAETRARCRLATQVLETGQPHPHYAWALSYVRHCPDLAGPALAAQWTTSVLPSSETFSDLVFSSTYIRDQRVLDAVAAVARSTSADQLLRLFALQVVATYVDSTVAVPIGSLRNPPRSTVLPLKTDVATIAGAVPPDANAPATIMALFDQLASSDPDPVIRGAGRYLSAALAPPNP